MELMPGYKRSDVGVIPDDWTCEPLSQFFAFISYGFTNPMPTVHDGIFMITAADINDGRLQLETARKTSEMAYRTLLSPKSRPRPNDILLTKDGTLGRLALVGDEVICINQSVAVIRPNDRVEPLFLKLLLESQRYQKRMVEDAGGSTIKHIYITIVDKMPLGLPLDRAEQRAIAQALSDVDALLTTLDQMIAKKRDLKQAAMQQLLTGKTRLPGFGGEWEAKPFSAVLNRLNAKSHQIQASEYQEAGKFPVVDQGKDFVVGFSDREDKRFRCPDGGVIVFGDHTCIVKFIDFDFLVGADGTQILHGKHGQNTRFHALQLQYRGIETTGYNRHFKILKEREFFVPPLPEQDAIASALSSMDAELAALESRREKTRNIKQAMMQELLTGKTRLV